MPLTVFISYAKEDHEFACELYGELRRRGHAPWMDKPPEPFDLDGLKPGERWKDAIDERIKLADLMILILSPVSVAKSGYVQVEFRAALHAMNSKPQNVTFAVPVLKEPCDVPPLIVGYVSLQDLQWTNVFETGVERFVDALEQMT